MSSVRKSTAMGIVLVLVSAIAAGVAFAILIIMPFGPSVSTLIALAFIASALVCWGWACFARPPLFEQVKPDSLTLRPSSRDQVKSALFLLLMLLMLGFDVVSLSCVILICQTTSLFHGIVIVAGVISVSAIVAITIHGYVRREIVAKSKFPICHDIWDEFRLCRRCRGWYAGLAFFGILMTVRSTLFLDLLRLVGPSLYTVLTILALASVPVHGALRRLKRIEGSHLLEIVGFAYSSSPFFLANLLIFLFH